MQVIFTKGAEFIWDCHTPSQKCQSSSALYLDRGRETIYISGYRAHEVTQKESSFKTMTNNVSSCWQL